jgi:hypothetical protein
LIDNEGNKSAISDKGVSLRTVMKALIKYNFLDERYYPYLESKKNDEPKEEYYKIAEDNKFYIGQYRKIIPNIYNMKYILSQLNLPIIAGIAIYDNFINLEQNNYIVPEPKDSKIVGYHAVLIVGYSNEDQTFEILNSYGQFFGDNGYFKLTNDWVMKDTLFFDPWVIELKEKI